jgi:hypothetical protein
MQFNLHYIVIIQIIPILAGAWITFNAVVLFKFIFKGKSKCVYNAITVVDMNMINEIVTNTRQSQVITTN